MTSHSVLATFLDPADGARVDAAFGSGFAFTYDTAHSGDGRAGPSPTEALLGSLVACGSLDVTSILRKKRQTVRRYEIAATGERTDEHPQVYTSIVVEHRVVGEVEEEALRRSIELSATRYCPVNAMLSASVRVEHRYRLWATGEEAGEGVSGLVAVTGPATSAPADARQPDAAATRD
jgi:putative redox protein